jgi:hypothetical protein
LNALFSELRCQRVAVGLDLAARPIGQGGSLGVAELGAARQQLVEEVGELVALRQIPRRLVGSTAITWDGKQEPLARL